VQVGLLDPKGLPVTGAESARKVVNPSLESYNRDLTVNVMLNIPDAAAARPRMPDRQPLRAKESIYLAANNLAFIVLLKARFIRAT
jgi:hypothetical protein